MSWTAKTQPTNNEFGDRLRYTRKRRGMTQTFVAKNCGFDHSLMSHFEAGRRKPSFEYIKRLCSIFGVSADYLLGLQARKNNRTEILDDQHW